jgi:ribosomal protein S6
MTNINETTFEESEGRVYELGFHLLPTVAEADVPVQFSQLKSTIEKQGGTFIAEGAPKLIKLSYSMSKTIKAEKMHYTNAYFGWVKFTLDPEKLEAVEKDIKAFDPMLRYIIVKTVAESTMVTEGVKAIGSDKEEPTDGEPVKENDILVDESPKEVTNQ